MICCDSVCGFIMIFIEFSLLRLFWGAVLHVASQGRRAAWDPDMDRGATILHVSIIVDWAWAALCHAE